MGYLRHAGIGIVVKDCNGRVLRRHKKYIGIATNNMAEYTALKEGLEIASRYGKDIIVMMDSELVVKQMRNEYRVRKAHLRDMIRQIDEMIARKNLNVRYVHIPREENADADNLAKDAVIDHLGTKYL